MINPHAIVESTISESVQVDEFAIIRKDVVIGENCHIHPFAIIESGVELGANVEVFPGAYIGKEPKGAGAISRQPEFNRKITIGDNCSISPHAVIFYDVTIANNTLIGDGASIREQCTIGSFCIISRYVTINYNTKIGSHVKIMDLTHITGNMVIEDNVFVSTMVATTNDNELGGKGYTEHIVGPHIKSGAMIGAGASLLPNTVIGANSVVAAAALVSKSVDDNALVMGVPAKFVRNVEGQR